MAAHPDEIPEPEPLPDTEVVLVTPETLNDLVRIQVEGYEMTPEDAALLAVGARHLIARPGVQVYLALVGGRPAATAELHLTEKGVGYLAGAATLAEFRGRGLQTLLIRLRAAEARRQGCSLMGAETAVGSQSQRNMEAQGMRLAYTKSTWVLP